MRRNGDPIDMSELEREFELEMEDGTQGEVASDEYEGADEEFEDEFEDTDEYETEFEDADQESDGPSSELYAERFFELGRRGFESEGAVDGEVNGLLREMERDYLFGALKNLRSLNVKKLIRKGIQLAGRRIPAFQALRGITQLARGNLKGMLGSLAQAGLASAVPGGAMALPALKALGFEAGDDRETEREAWRNYVGVARESFEELARGLNEAVDQPQEASRLATTAFQRALRRAAPIGRLARGYRVGPAGRGLGPRRRRVIRLRPGDRIVIIRAEDAR